MTNSPPDETPAVAAPTRVRPRILSGALLAAGAVCVELANGVPAGALGWSLVAASIVLAISGTCTEPLLERLRQRRRSVASPPALDDNGPIRRENRRRHIAHATAGLLFVGVVLTVQSHSAFAAILVGDCAEPVELRVMAPSESFEAFDRITDEFTDTQSTFGCRLVNATAYPANWDQARDAMSGAWTPHAQRTLGPPADVWFAESKTEVDVARAEAKRQGQRLPIAERSTFAWTPLVVGVPAGSEPAVDRAPASTSALLSALRRDGTVVRPDPSVSYAGLRHTETAYAGLSKAEIRRLEHELAWAAHRAKIPAGDEKQTLCHHRAGDGTSAVMTTEVSVVAYNSGDPLGADCPLRYDGDAALTAFYPKQSGSLDYTAVSLHRKTSEARSGSRFETRRHAAADDFVAWLTSADGVRAVRLQGLRPVDFSGGQPLTADNGVDDGARPAHTPADPSTLVSAFDGYQKAKVPTDVLMAVDASGSMSTEADNNGNTRFDIARQGVRDALDRLGPEDRFGLRLFPGDKPLLDLESDEDPQRVRDTAVAALDSEKADGDDTPLYRAIDVGIEEVSTAKSQAIPAVVVVTDGANTADGPKPSTLAKKAAEEEVQVHFIAIGTASCEGTPIAEIATASGGTCQDVKIANLSSGVDDLFARLWGTE